MKETITTIQKRNVKNRKEGKQENKGKMGMNVGSVRGNVGDVRRKGKEGRERERDPLTRNIVKDLINYRVSRRALKKETTRTNTVLPLLNKKDRIVTFHSFRGEKRNGKEIATFTKANPKRNYGKGIRHKMAVSTHVRGG